MGMHKGQTMFYLYETFTLQPYRINFIIIIIIMVYTSKSYCLFIWSPK